MFSLLLALQLQLPAPTGYINDFAGVLDPQSRQDMQIVINQVKQKSGGEIVVVTLNDLGGRPSIDVARDIGRQWKVGAMGGAGDRARNAGVILLFKPGARPGDGQADVAIATGSGSEGFITDAQAGRIRDAIGQQSVAAGSYARGLTTGVAMLGQAYAAEFTFELTGEAQQVTQQAAPEAPRIPPVFLIVLAILLFGFMTRVFRYRSRGLGSALFWAIISSRGGRGGWSGASRGGGWGGGGGGFGGFGGGGGFSGGGASGRF